MVVVVCGIVDVFVHNISERLTQGVTNFGAHH